MDNLVIREGLVADAPAITDIINHEIRTGLAIWRYAERTLDDVRAMIEARLMAGQAVYIAQTDGEVLGWASYGDFRAGEGYGGTMEHSVHISPAHQRKGIARALMERLIEHADAAGIHVLIGAIDATNTGSIALHEKLGFVEVGRLPEVGWKFDQWLTLSLMQRTRRSQNDRAEVQ